jgi:hypothetical protein
MSSPTLPTPGSLPPDLQVGPILVPEGQSGDELAVRIEQQRASIRVLEPAAEEEGSQKAECRSRDVRRQRVSTAVSTAERRVIFYQQEEQRRKDRQARDESCMQAFLRHEVAAKEEKEKREREKRGKREEKVREAEERRLAKVRERELKQALRDQRDQQRRIERQRREEAAGQDLLRRKAAIEARRAQDAENYKLREEQRMAAQRAREQEQLLLDRQDQQRRLERQAQDEACMQALIRHETATKAKMAQEAEERRLAKVSEREQQWPLRD